MMRDELFKIYVTTKSVFYYSLKNLTDSVIRDPATEDEILVSTNLRGFNCSRIP